MDIDSYLIELTITDWKTDLPTIGWFCSSIMNNGFLIVGLLGVKDLGIQFCILWKWFDGNLGTIEINWNSLNTASQIINTFLDQCFKILIHLSQFELCQVWLEWNARKLFTTFVGCDSWLALLWHVVIEGLSILEFTFFVCCLDNEFGTENVAQLGTITVTTTCHFLLIVIIIGRCQQMAKDQFWYIDTLFLVHCHWNTTTIVVDWNQVGFTINQDFDGGHGRITDLSKESISFLSCIVVFMLYLVISCIDQDFIHNLV